MAATVVQAVGYRLALGKNISIGEIYQQLETVENKETNINGKTYVLLTDVVDRHIVGLVLSYKGDKKSIATYRDTSGDLVVQENKLADNQHKTEVVIFRLNPTTLTGAMFQYHGSMSTTGLAQFLRSQHQVVKRSLVKDKYNELSQFGKKNKERARKKANEHYKGDLNLTNIYTQKDLTGLLSSYQHISSMEVLVDSQFQYGKPMEALTGVSSGGAISVRFDRQWKIGEVKAAIRRSATKANREHYRALSIIGRSVNGEPLREYLGDNLEHFFKLDYDDYISLLPKSKWKTYVECGALRKLKEIMDEQSFTFGEAEPVEQWKKQSAKDYNS